MKKSALFLSVILFPFFLFAQTLSGLDEIAPFNEGLAAVRKGETWGFINKKGELVIDFRADLVWQEKTMTTEKDFISSTYPRFVDGRCMIKSKMPEERITVYGFIDKNGKEVISPEYLNITEFQEGYALGILVTKSFRGKNNFQLNIYDYNFSEVLLDIHGDIMLLIKKRDGISMSTRRYERPLLTTKFLSPKSLALKTSENTWEIKSLDL